MLSVALLSFFLVAEPPIAEPDSLGLESSPSSCVVPTAPNPNAPAVYQLSPDGSVPAGLVGPAIAAWNSPGCNPNGTGFPTFSSTPEPGAIVIPVRFEPGPNPAGPSECGQWNPNTGVITLFATASMPDGGTGSCGSTQYELQSLEHEMGHVLRLGDVSSSTCPGYIMSQVAYPPQTGPLPQQPMTRSIHSAECSEANQQNTTPAERTPPPPPPPVQCPPTCTCPPTCQTGCDANGVCKDSPCLTDPTLPQCSGDGGNPGDPCDADDPCDDGGIVKIPPPALLPPRHLYCGFAATLSPLHFLLFRVAGQAA